MLTALLILTIGLAPSLVSIWVMRKAGSRTQARLHRVMESVANRNFSVLRLAPEQEYIDGMGYVIGDITCRFNARSSYIRCAVNPIGPCEACSHYQPKVIEP